MNKTPVGIINLTRESSIKNENNDVVYAYLNCNGSWYNKDDRPLLHALLGTEYLPEMYSPDPGVDYKIIADGLSEAPAIFDPSLMNTLWKDEARTIPVTSIFDEVKGITDITGGGQHAITNGIVRYNEDINGLGYLELSGGASIVIEEMQATIFTSFEVPGVGGTILAKDSGGVYWGAPRTEGTSVGRFAMSRSWTTLPSFSNRYAPGTLTSLAQMFLGEELYYYGVSNWDVSLIEDFSEMFSGAIEFDDNLSGWDTSSATTMSEMFSNALYFRSSVANFNVSNVIDMYGMFFNAQSFNHPLDLWDTVNVYNMSSMFQDATLFNQDLTGWCVSLIISEPAGFSLNSALTELNKPVWGTCPL